MTTTESDKHYSIIEVEELLTSTLNDANTTRLIKIFTYLGCNALADMSGEDVLNQVIVKVLGMDRKWPKKMQAIQYLINTGKSIINNESEKRKHHHNVDSIEDYIHTSENKQETVCPTATKSHPSPQVMLQSEQSSDRISGWINQIMDLFHDDEEANCFIKQKLSNIVKAKILQLCGFSDQVYRNVEKRIKYKVRSRFPNGLPWWEVTE